MTISSARLREVLHYAPDSGVWTWLQSLSLRGPVGARAGCVKPSGYRNIGVDGQSYRSSRLAHFYMTGEWPLGRMDHKDLDTLNDSWSNLREATPTQNNANVPRRANNSSGYKGVSWCKQTRKWAAFLQIGGRNRRVGNFATKEEAHTAYAIAATAAFGEFARAS